MELDLCTPVRIGNLVLRFKLNGTEQREINLPSPTYFLRAQNAAAIKKACLTSKNMQEVRSQISLLDRYESRNLEQRTFFAK